MTNLCQPEATTLIYVLLDPMTYAIRYVGKADNPKLRLREHISKSVREKGRKPKWIRSLIADGLRPVIQAIDEVKQSEWQAAEAAYIEYYLSIGCDLTNDTPGGDGWGCGEDHPQFGNHAPRGPRSLETKAKISAANSGRKYPPEYGARISLARRGRRLSPEHRAKIGLAQAGRKRIISAEGREKMRAANLGERNHGYGKHLSKETKAKLRAALTGRQRSPEHCANIGKAHKGKTVSPELRARISAKLMGHKMPQETRDKISATTKGRPAPWARRPWTEQQRIKIVTALKGQVRTAEQRAKTSAAITAWHERRRNSPSLVKTDQ